jgi:hypothetical protein
MERRDTRHQQRTHPPVTPGSRGRLAASPSPFVAPIRRWSARFGADAPGQGALPAPPQTVNDIANDPSKATDFALSVGYDSLLKQIG